jgi:flagellar motor switch protein FliM
MQIPDVSGAQAEVLSQSDVERLLQQVQEQENTTLVVAAAGKRERHKQENIQPYDFRQPAFLAPGELRKLRLRHEEFIRSLAARLSIYLRLEFSLQMSKLQTISYQKFAEGLGSPTHLTLFKAEPLKGICLLDIPPRLGLAIVDRLLGGAAQSYNTSRELTEIETALLDRAVQIILNEWCNHWQVFQDLRPALLGHENNGRFLQTAPHDTVMLCLSMETRVGDCMEQMQLAFPHYTLEPIVKHLAALGAAEREFPSTNAPTQVRWNPEMDDVAVTVTADWNGLQLTARELAALKPGDTVLLDPELAGQVRVRIAAAPKFQGRLGTRAGKWAVELQQTLNA